MAIGDSDQIRRSAELYAAGETLGLSREQTEQLVTNMQAGNARQAKSSKGRPVLKRGGGVSRTEAENSLLEAAAALQGTEVIADKYQDFTEEEAAFGRSDGQFREYIGEPPENEYVPEDKSVGTRKYKRNDGSFSKPYKMVDKVRPEEEGFANNDALRTASPSAFRTQIGALESAAIQLQQAKNIQAASLANMSPIERMMAIATGGKKTSTPDMSNLDIYKTRLAQYAEPGRDMYGNDRQAAIDAVQATLAMQDPELSKAAKYRNEVRAYNEAQDIARSMFTSGGIGAQADLNIRDLGATPAELAAAMPAAGFNSAGVAINPNTGNPLGTYGPQHALMAQNNDGSVANALNAPINNQSSGTGAGEFVFQALNQGQPAKIGQQFGNINEVTSLVGSRMAESGIDGDILAANNIRTPQELQAFAEEMVSAGMEMEAVTNKKSMLTWSDKSNKPVPISASEATIADVLTTLKLRPAQQQQLGVALGTMAQAPASARMDSYMDNTGQVYTPSAPVEFGEMKFGPGEITANTAEASGRAPVGDRRVPGSADWMPKGNLAPAIRRLGQGPAFIGAALDAEGNIERDAGPGYLNRYKSSATAGLHGQDIANKLFAMAQERADRQGTEVDVGRERSNIVKGMLTDIRAERANTERARKMDAVISSLPPGMRKEDIGNRAVYMPGQMFGMTGPRRKYGSVDGFWGS